MQHFIKLVIYTPETHAVQVRQALAESGAGKLGNYDACSFSTKGMGRFRANPNAKPTIGTVGLLEAIEEERIEVTLTRDRLAQTIQAIRQVHPYEEIPIDVYSLENLADFIEQ
jgi:hypothetical protein